MPKKTMFAKCIAERTKLRKGRSDEIERKAKNINNEFFKTYFTFTKVRTICTKK